MKKRTIYISVDDEIALKLEKEAEENTRTINNQVVHIIKKYYDQPKDQDSKSSSEASDRVLFLLLK